VHTGYNDGVIMLILGNQIPYGLSNCPCNVSSHLLYSPQCAGFFIYVP